ncbi:MAG: GH116 family glycosyl-hydrolase [Candidatus Zipacnadales bacterium]
MYDLNSGIHCYLIGGAIAMCVKAPSMGEIVFDFETGDLQGWTVVEGEFAQVISDRMYFHNTPAVPYNKQGTYFLSTLEMPDGSPNDSQVGIVVSPVFTLSGPTVTLLVGGGAHGNTYVALCNETGEELRRASGANREEMQRVEWDVRDLVGSQVFVKIVDHNTGSWGHVTLDDFRAQGEIDLEATQQLVARFAVIEAQRLAVIEARRAVRLKELTDQTRLFARGEQTVYAGERLGAISLPIGGIGAGHIEIDGRAVRHRWYIFNNAKAASLPQSFFAVRAAVPGAEPVVRALQTEPVGPFAPVATLTFRGEYPFGWYDFADPELPVQVSMEIFSPLIPLNTRDSAFPCTLVNLTARNEGGTPLRVAFLATQQNPVGFTGGEPLADRYHAALGGNRNAIVSSKSVTLLHMTADLPKDAPGAGDMVLMALAKGTGTASWETLDSLADDFTADKFDGPAKSGPSPGGQTLNGALMVSCELQPNESRTIPFVLAWYFPNARHGQQGWGGFGNRYAIWWSSAREVAREVQERFEELTRLTRRYHDTLYETNLPIWLLDRLSSQAAILSSHTCFWTRSGYFGGWEGCNEAVGCCPGNCSHVWHYAQLHARLFPELGRRMREQEFRYQHADGLIPFRQGLINSPAADAQSGAVLNSYREHLLSPDGTWLHTHWPAIKRAMEFQISHWDADEDGVLSGAQHNTLDAESTGSSSWLGSLYLAALAAAEKMAIIEGDQENAARYRRIRESGAARQDETLWNGEYYIQLPETPLGRDYGPGCHIDQLLGQWWADQLDLGAIYPRSRIRRALEALVRHNFRPDFYGITQLPRKFVADEDAGMQMITWPRGGRPDPAHCMLYADEVMSGFEYAAAATMIRAGLITEGFSVLHAAYQRYNGRLRENLPNGAWGYSGNPFGDDECGKFYARPMSIWSVLLACQGFIYDGPAGVIGFTPIWRPEDHHSFFTAAEGWGVFHQSRTVSAQKETLELRYGSLRLRSLVFTLAAAPRKLSVRLDDRSLPATFVIDGERTTVKLQNEVVLTAGQTLTITFEQVHCSEGQ